MSKDGRIWWEIPRRPDTEWLFKSVLDEKKDDLVESDDPKSSSDDKNMRK